MTWDTIQLGKVMDVKHGHAFKSEFFADSGEYVLLTPGNCDESGGLKLKGDKEKYFVGEVPAEFLLNGGDLLVVMTDLINTAPILGRSFLIPENNRFLHNQRLGLVQIADASRIDKTFLYYLLNTHDYRAQVRGSASGATVRHTAPGRIKACKVRIPRDLTYQRRIGEMLSAYDDFIENNRQRVALLEKAARLLYREWFVRLRFPGHEHAAVTGGVPEGWERKTVGENLTLKRGYDLSDADRILGDIPIVSSSGITGFHNSRKADPPGVVTGRYGTLGEVYFLDRAYWPLNTALYVKDFKGNPPGFIAHFLRHTLQRIQSDKAAVPGLNRNVVHGLTVLWPSKTLRDQFDEFARSTYRQISLLNATNERLRTARDLLLPRLMNGDIAV